MAARPSSDASATFDHHWRLVRRWERLSADPAFGLGRRLVVALEDLRRLDHEGLRLAPEGRLEHLVHRVNKDELDLLANLVGDVAEGLLVLPRQDEGPGAGGVRGEDLAFQSADRQAPPPQRALARHRDVLGEGDAGRRVYEGGGHGDPGGGTVLRDRSRRYVDVE